VESVRLLLTRGGSLCSAPAHLMERAYKVWLTGEQEDDLQRFARCRRQLRLVEEAMDRLDAGDYGICLACDEPIAEKRLRALPWARYCVTCQENAGLELDTYREEVGKG